jgi:hypothetical protein
MLLGLIIAVFGICVAVSFYMAFLTVKSGDSPWLFISFGLLFSIPFLIALIKLAAKNWLLFRVVERTLFGQPEPKTTFVPHWFMMAAIILTGILALAAILIPIFLK